MTYNLINWEIFNQLLQLDDNDQHDFSKQLLLDFFSLLDETIDKMNTKIQENEFKQVNEFGHFLKGGAAGIGASGIAKICEKIQIHDYNSFPNEINKTYFQSLINELQEIVPNIKQELFDAVQ